MSCLTHFLHRLRYIERAQAIYLHAYPLPCPAGACGTREETEEVRVGVRYWICRRCGADKGPVIEAPLEIAYRRARNLPERFRPEAYRAVKEAGARATARYRSIADLSVERRAA